MDVFRESYLRANVIAWLPIGREDRVLYIGREDVVAAKLRERSGEVFCAASAGEIPLDRAYDYIICLGEAKEEAFRVFAGCLAGNGRFLFAAENAYGLRYLAGVKEIGSGEYFGAVEALEGAVGWTKEGLLQKLNEAGFDGVRFYYPFPDYWFAMSIYSDRYLPKAGELIDQVGNFEAERLVLFDEAKAADALIARGRFPEFSSSYLVVAGKTAACPVVNWAGEEILYVKFSNDRGLSHNIRTYITKSADGKRHLIKKADTVAAAAQVAHLQATAKRLEELYADSRFAINACRMRAGGAYAADACRTDAGAGDPYAMDAYRMDAGAGSPYAAEPEYQDGQTAAEAELAYLQGQTMEEILDRMLAEGAYDRAEETLLKVLEEIAACKGQQEFQRTEGFERVFGSVALPDGLLAAPASDIDMILPNILVDADGRWNLIDYEWSFHFPIPVHFLLYRCIRYYAETTAERRKLYADRLYRKAGISAEELLAYGQMEEAFQAYVLDGHVPLRQLYKEYGRPAYHISSILNVIDEQERRRALQVYFDKGNGFSEEESIFYHSKALDGTYRLEIPVSEEVQRLRIDPGSQACTVDIRQLGWKTGPGGMLDFISNGHKMAEGMYLFDTDDPNLLLEGLPAGSKTLLLDLRIDSMSLAAAEWIAPKIDTKYRLKKMWKK